MAYVHQLLDQPSQWQTSQQAGPGSVPKFTSTLITDKQLLIKNINQSKSSLLISHYVSYLFLLLQVSWIAIKLDCKDTRSHVYAHITIFRLRERGGEITQENKNILNLQSTHESQIPIHVPKIPCIYT